MTASLPDRDQTPLAVFFREGEGAEESQISVRSPAVRIGQGPQNDIVLDDDTVSTRHARLEFVDGGWRLTDLESTNGTYVDGVRLAAGVPTPLIDNAAVAFGAVRLAFRPLEGADPEAATAAYLPPPEERPAPRARGMRLPLWVLLLILIAIALVVFLVLTLGGDPGSPQQPVTEPITALVAAFATGSAS